MEISATEGVMRPMREANEGNGEHGGGPRAEPGSTREERPGVELENSPRGAVPSDQASRVIEFCVYGTPISQGSKRHVGGGNMIEVSKNLRPWRAEVKAAAIEELTRLGLFGHGPAIVGPVDLELVFTVTKPKSASKRKKTYPDKRPDISKCIRSVEDSLTDAGMYEDDARIVRELATKVFPNEGEGSLGVPGVRIKVKQFEG